MQAPKICNVKYINELEELKLDRTKYTIMGSSVMAAHNIRTNNNIDIMVGKELFDKISKDNRFKPRGYCLGKSYYYKHISVFKNFPPYEKPAEQVIEESINIDGYNFITLHMLVSWKTLMNRSKDRKDIKLIITDAKQFYGKDIHKFMVDIQLPYFKLIMQSGTSESKK